MFQLINNLGVEAQTEAQTAAQTGVQTEVPAEAQPAPSQPMDVLLNVLLASSAFGESINELKETDFATLTHDAVVEIVANCTLLKYIFLRIFNENTFF